jgi:hypothetical protein
MQNELFEKIELYLHNELKGEELQLFEEQLKNDAELRVQVDLYKTIDNEMRQKTSGSEGEDQLKKTLSDLNKKYFNQQKSPAKVVPMQSRKRRMYVAAAVALLVIAGSYWFFFTGSSKNSEVLYAQYAVHESLSSQRSNIDSAKILQDAIAAYNNKKYDEALTGLITCLQKDSSDAELVLVKNICLTETGNYDQAIAGFDRLALSNEIFKYQAIWHKALVYLKQGDKTASKKILETIPADADMYGKAQELLKEL